MQYLRSGIEGASVDGDILKGDILDPAMGIVVGDVAGDEVRLVAREVDILEALSCFHQMQ